jgi:hypothetical protein
MCRLIFGTLVIVPSLEVPMSISLTPIVMPDLSSQITALQARVAALEAIIQVVATGEVLIKTANKVRIETGILDVKTDTDVNVKAGSSLNLTCATSMTVKSTGGTGLVSAPGALTIKGGTVSIN